MWNRERNIRTHDKRICRGKRKRNGERKKKRIEWMIMVKKEH